MKQSRTENILPDSLNVEDIKAELVRKKFQCPECMKFFSSNQSLKEHQFLHTKARPYSCSLCGKSFRYGSQLCIHKRTHFAPVEIKCPKLTDLIRSFVQPDTSLVLLTEVVRLPPLKNQQVWEIPAFLSTFRGCN
jgi:uncharacterized Zn-finger protein